MFTDTEKEMNTIADNLAHFAKDIVDFIKKVLDFFKTLGDLVPAGEEE